MLVGACFKGEPVRQPVPSHERHVQCICIGRDVGVYIYIVYDPHPRGLVQVV
jgi:hypothetical protein